MFINDGYCILKVILFNVPTNILSPLISQLAYYLIINNYTQEFAIFIIIYCKVFEFHLVFVMRGNILIMGLHLSVLIVYKASSENPLATVTKSRENVLNGIFV